MTDFVKRFVSDLYKNVLKPMGFRRSGQTFLRDHETYTESFQIQGSSWNGRKSVPRILDARVEAWRFYINVGVQIAKLPPGAGWSRPGEHASGRIEGIATESPGVYELLPSNLAELAEQIQKDIRLASSMLPEMLPAVRRKAERGVMEFLPPADAQR
jgi:hypothetical protein